MKKGFTMIELIFVIVILGILATVAIPKISATRDDAEFTKLSSNIATIAADFASFYMTQDKLSDDLKAMTAVAFKPDATSAKKGILQVKGKNCLEIERTGDQTIKFTKSTTNQDTSGVCEGVLNQTNIKNLLSFNYACPSFNAKKTTSSSSNDTYVQNSVPALVGCTQQNQTKSENIVDNGAVTIVYGGTRISW